MNERENKIIQQATSYLIGDRIYNSKRLQDRIDEAIKVNALDAFWELHHDLTHPNDSVEEKNYMKRLIDYKGESNSISWTRELGAILRGERLEK